MNKPLLITMAVSGFLAVALGAFGAHGLKPHLSIEELQWFETGNRYHFYHTLAALAGALLMIKFDNRWLKFSCITFLLGIVLFSGSLYGMAVTGIRTLGIVTPLGGLAFLVGWGMMLIAFLNPTDDR